jgi:hypothetical protein
MMRILTTFLFILAINASALEPDEIKALAVGKHDRSHIMEALKIYPDGRAYNIVVKTGLLEMK